MSEDNSEVWDLDIFEIKIGSIDGLSFRVGQQMTIKGIRRIVTSIEKVFVEDQPQYQVFVSDDIEGGTNPKLAKIAENLPVYLTMDI